MRLKGKSIFAIVNAFFDGFSYTNRVDQREVKQDFVLNPLKTLGQARVLQRILFFSCI
jgi:hypothetical protein